MWFFSSCFSSLFLSRLYFLCRVRSGYPVSQYHVTGQEFCRERLQNEKTKRAMGTLTSATGFTNMESDPLEWPPLWSSGQSSWLQIQRSGFDSRHYLIGSLVVTELGYKPECRGFETRWGEILNLPNLSGRTRPWGFTQPVTEMSTGNIKKKCFWGSKVRLVSGADSLTAIYELIV
jgi:hypothetical protein